MERADMNHDAQPVRAPAGARAWTPDIGWLYEREEVPRHVEAGAVALVVSDDGWLRGVTDDDHAPLAAVLRIDGDLAEVVERIDALADRAEGLDTGLAVEVSMLKARVRQLENRGQV